MERTMIPENLKQCRFCKKHTVQCEECSTPLLLSFVPADEIKEYGKAMYESGKIGELVCDGCGCHPTMIYNSEKGRFCNQCNPK